MLFWIFNIKEIFNILANWFEIDVECITEQIIVDNNKLKTC